MNQFFNTIFSILRSRVTKIWTKLRLWTSAKFIQTRLLVLLRKFFTQILDVRPRNKKDYYSVFHWLVSKRLAFAVVIILGVFCSFYLFSCLPQGFFGGGDSTIPTYRYDALPLKFYNGTVRILAKDGHLAYQGEVSKVQCNGEGTLYGIDGLKIYEGQFAKDMYNGSGTLYYPSERLRYVGQFVDNLFQGQGTIYRENGTMEYSGEFQNGMKNGTGTLYNAAASPIFTGTFQNDQILFQEFLGKSAAQAAEMYSGDLISYVSTSEYAVSMNEIGAVYAATDGSTQLNGEWTISEIYILSESFPTEDGAIDTINDLTDYFGSPDYFGSSYVTLPEAVTINLLAQKDPQSVVPVEMQTDSPFIDSVTVNSYDKNYEVYIYTYLKDGLLYTFYAPSSGQETFLLYSIALTQ